MIKSKNLKKGKEIPSLRRVAHPEFLWDGAGRCYAVS